jgi:hypothetical protein
LKFAANPSLNSKTAHEGQTSTDSVHLFEGKIAQVEFSMDFCSQVALN